MISRIAFSVSMALVGLYGATAPAFAAKGPDGNDVMLGTAATAAIMMAIISVVYAAKWALGLAEPDRSIPPNDHYYSVPPDGDGHDAGHGGHH